MVGLMYQRIRFDQRKVHEQTTEINSVALEHSIHRVVKSGRSLNVPNKQSQFKAKANTAEDKAG